MSFTRRAAYVAYDRDSNYMFTINADKLDWMLDLHGPFADEAWIIPVEVLTYVQDEEIPNGEA